MPATQCKRKIDYPMGTESHATMRAEDLIPTFTYSLKSYATISRIGNVSRKDRKNHLALVRDIEARTEVAGYYESDNADYDLDSLFDALCEYAAPYFYFGAHPGDGSDYGYWLSEGFDEDFITLDDLSDGNDHLKVNDLSEVPARFRGEVLVVNDHGNCTLYVKTSRTIREIWSVV